MGIRAKQMLASTFTSTEVSRVFAAQSISGSVLVNGTISATQIANGTITGTQLSTSVAGNGLTGGGGSALSILPNTTDDGAVPGVEVAANGLRLSAAAAGNGLTGGAGSALAVGAGTGITVGADSVGLNTTNPSLSYGADTVVTYANGVTAKGLFVTGTMVDANHVANKAYVDNAASGLLWKNPVQTANLIGNVVLDGLVGNAAALTIEGLTPISGDAYVVTTANGVGALSTAAVGDIWQYVTSSWVKIVTNSGGFVPNGTYCLLSTATTLISPYTPTTHNGYRVRFNGSDNDPTDQGAADFFAPSTGDAYVLAGAGEGVIHHQGAIHEWNLAGDDFVHITDPTGGFVTAGVRAILGAVPGTTVLISPYTDTVDDGKVVQFSGSSNTGSFTGDAVDTASLLVTDDAHLGVNDGIGYVFQGTVPTGEWVQFTGAGTINAGAGLSKTGSTIDVGDANKGVQVNSDDLQIDASEIAGDGIKQRAGAGNEHWLDLDLASGGGLKIVSTQLSIEPNDFAGTGLEDDGSDNLRIAAAAAGDGLGGGAGNPLSADVAVAAGAQQYGGIVKDRTSNGTGAASANAGYLAVKTDNSTLNVDASNQLAVKASGITGTQLNASVAGNGLTGGGGSALAVGAGNGITVNTDDVAVNPAALVADSGGTPGAAAIDADRAIISWVPSNYTRDSGPTEAGAVTHLTAHLKGIDNFLLTAGGTPRQELVASQTITGTDTALTDTLNNTPKSNASLRLFLNGILQTQGAGADYTVSGTTITWLASTGTAVDMDTSDVLVAAYES